MSILAAANQNTVIGAALAYLSLGMSIVPVVGKKVPMASYGKYHTQRATVSDVHYWHKNSLLRGVGILGGAVSGNLCLVDLDGLDAVARFEFHLPELLDTFTVLSGSEEGKHLYLYADELPTSTKTAGYELRVHGLYVVAPPSKHPETGKLYRVSNPVEIKRVPNLNSVVDFIAGIVAERKKEPPKSTTDKPSIVVLNSTAYGKSALATAYRNVLTALDNNRNNTLYREALKLGSLVADGHISVSEVERELIQACRNNGLAKEDTERQCMRTIKSGLDNGMRNSRQQWRKSR